MKNLLILGAGTAGTIMANRMHKRLPAAEWQLTIVDRSPLHYYQPGFLFIPFGIYTPEQVVRNKVDQLPVGMNFLIDEVEQIEPEQNRVRLKGGKLLPYDYLIIATGADIHPEETEGLNGSLWRKSIFDFYTFDGATALASALKDWPGGRLVVNVTEMPIKCPVAPLEFLFLADDFFTHRGIRDKVDLHFVTPLSGAFTRPQASKQLGSLLATKGIRVTPDFSLARVDTEKKTIVAWDGQEVPFDLLVDRKSTRVNSSHRH